MSEAEQDAPRQPGPLFIVALACLAHVFSLANNGTFPALIPLFQTEWGLTNSQSGWISGIYFGGYLLGVPVLVTATDRVNPRGIYIGSAILGSVATVAFAFLAQGFWSALLLRALAGLGMAGTYMVGLRLVTDRLQGSQESRGASFNLASFSVGAGALDLPRRRAGGARLAPGLPGGRCDDADGDPAGSPAAACPAATAGRARRSSAGPAPGAAQPLSARLQHRLCLPHLGALRLADLARRLPGLRPRVAWAGRPGRASPTQWATLLFMLGLPASVLGNEAALRWGRRRSLTLIMLASASLAMVLGFAALLPLEILLALVVLHAVLVNAGSSSLTAGAIAAATSHRGATMAVHSLLGFGFAFTAPLVVGLALDLGGATPLGWGAALASLGLMAAIGPLALKLLAKG